MSSLPKEIDEALDLLFADPKDLKSIPDTKPDPKIWPHGRVVEMRWEAYGDRYIYEDGYEEFYDIGD